MNETTVLITGCSSGIGAATAERFLAEGWRVYATARNTDDVADLADHEACRALELDVTVDGDCRRAVDRVLRDADRIDALVNNAGYGQFGAVEHLPVERVRRQFDVNVLGPHRLVRRVVPEMREQGAGTVVNVSSPWGRVAAPGVGAYAGSKAALESMTDALRAEVDGLGVDAVLVEPGPVDTRFYDSADLAFGEADGPYGALRNVFEDVRAAGGLPGTLAPERVADVIVEAACAPDPNPRYRVGAWPRLAELGRILPDRLRDRAYGLVERVAGR